MLGVEIPCEVYRHFIFQQLLEMTSLRGGMHRHFVEEELPKSKLQKTKTYAP